MTQDNHLPSLWKQKIKHKDAERQTTVKQMTRKRKKEMEINHKERILNHKHVNNRIKAAAEEQVETSLDSQTDNNNIMMITVLLLLLLWT